MIGTVGTAVASETTTRMQLTRSRSSLGSTRSRRSRRLHASRGATMVEYALLIIAIMFLAAVAYRNLGKSARKNADESSSTLLER